MVTRRSTPATLLPAFAKAPAHRIQQAEQQERRQHRQQREDRARLAPEQARPRPGAGTSCRRRLRRARPACPCPGAACDCAYSAAFGSCVTMMMVLPWSRLSCCSRARISSADCRSRSPVGSSQTSSVGSDTMARAIATRCCCPPDSSLGLCAERVREPDQLQRDAGVALALRAPKPGQQQRQLDVPPRRQHRQQIVELEHETHVRGAPFRQRALGQMVDPLPADRDAALGRGIEPADQIQQGGLARARGAHERQEIALLDIEVDVMQHLDLLLAALVDLAQLRSRPERSCRSSLLVQHSLR